MFIGLCMTFHRKKDKKYMKQFVCLHSVNYSLSNIGCNDSKKNALKNSFFYNENCICVRAKDFRKN
jgi:hypothetical protein